jgi:DNA-binding MarR family transcriptional regulator
MKKDSIAEIRAFNRWYTDLIGLLNRHLPYSERSLGEGRLLFEIHAGQPMQASQLISILHIDKSYLSRLLKKLEKEKLIAKKKSPGDARASLLSLTDKGMRIFDTLNKASDAQIGGLLQPLSETQRGQLVGHLQAVMQLLNSKPQSHE